MADKSLVMSFLNEQGKRASLTVNSVREDVTQAEVTQLMDTIIAKNIFKTTGGDIKSRDSAQITEKNVTSFEVK